tara:strand:+ start:3040 stop:4032 length:993 start_codon:yes stop_codon:yes gene_type:complete
MKNIINRLIKYQVLSKEEAKQIIIDISEGKLNNSQISSFLTVYMMRNISLDELEGFREALLDLCIYINLNEFDAIDLCGTGGDGKDTFNISTLASFVTAGAKVNVAKHGNYGVSSGCGSSNVLEHLGIKFTNDENKLQEAIDKSGICFLHAPLFHPAMKNVAPVRKDLGLKTFFNILGPLVNPSKPNKQIVGVFNLELARTYNYFFQKTNKKYSIIYSLDGYDEISLTGETKIYNNHKEFILKPEQLGLVPINSNDIIGGNDVDSSAKIFMNVLNDNATEHQKNVVCSNAAIAISTSKEISLIDAFSLAKESIDSKSALKAFETLKKINQ